MFERKINKINITNTKSFASKETEASSKRPKRSCVSAGVVRCTRNTRARSGPFGPEPVFVGENRLNSSQFGLYICVRGKSIAAFSHRRRVPIYWVVIECLYIAFCQCYWLWSLTLIADDDRSSPSSRLTFTYIFTVRERNRNPFVQYKRM